MYDTIFFDLDGTLTEPAEGICNSFRYALQKMSIEENDAAKLFSYIGPPLGDTFAKYGFEGEVQDTAICYYREYFGRRGKFENRVYDGVPQMLAELKKQGKKLVVATSKLEKFSVEIVEHFGLAQYFDFVAGASADGSISKKKDVLEYAFRRAGVTDKSRAVMVGDRHYDVTGAIEAGIDCIGVTYGYGSREELESAGARYIATTVQDLLKHII